ncbi:MAG TPA: cobyric acid synthase [Gaiellaceae bacterium]|nr:cobyric acid synthase [Gaiellaceae bacterium]
MAVQGVSSWAGKSLVTTALCRFFARRGVRVAPFKGQNMSNNARVVEGGEIGVAQYLQALAAGVRPDVRMNPVLVKPEGERQSQVVVEGKPDLELSALPWRERGPMLWPPIERALHELLGEFDLVVIEGAGSPAEINLRSTDHANMRVSQAAGAPVILVADIDRGGAFAHLYGTWSLVEPEPRRSIQAFVLNKFRGDPALLAPAPAELERMTGVPVAGVLPMLQHGLPDEDGATQHAGGGRRGPRVAVVRYPTASNLDEFRAAEQVADVVFATTPSALDGADLVVLPGSKHVASDLMWLRATGIDKAVRERARRGRRVLGICGGLQMLGERVLDPDGVEGAATGLGLLPVETAYGREKVTREVTARFGAVNGAWTALAGLSFRGYEIRHGQTTSTGAANEALAGGLGFVDGPVLGISVHGLLEDPGTARALLGAAPEQSLDDVFEALADAIEEHLDTDLFVRLAGLG